MAKAKVTRRNPNEEDEIREFNNSTPFEHLNVGDVVELKFSEGEREQCVVISTGWDFTFFGATFEVVVKPK